MSKLTKIYVHRKTMRAVPEIEYEMAEHKDYFEDCDVYVLGKDMLDMELANLELSHLCDACSGKEYQLRAHLSAMTAERDGLRAMLEKSNSDHLEARTQVATLRAQIAMARKGLTRGCHCRFGGDICECCLCLAALEKTAGTEGGGGNG